LGKLQKKTAVDDLRRRRSREVIYIHRSEYSARCDAQSTLDMPMTAVQSVEKTRKIVFGSGQVEFVEQDQG
jgi:hypothetical protein